MTVSSEVIYYWQRDKAQNYHLCAVEIITDQDQLKAEHSAIINGIAADPDKTAFLDGCLRLLAGALVVANGTAPQQPPGAQLASVATTVPTCPVHGGAMQVSRHLNKGAFASFYCSRREADGFCKCSADVMPTGATRHRTKA